MTTLFVVLLATAVIVLVVLWMESRIMARRKIFDFGAIFEKVADKVRPSFTPIDEAVYSAITGTLTPTQRAWFDEIHEQLDHGTMSAREAEVCLSEYYARCRDQRQVIDTSAVTRLMADIAQARQREQHPEPQAPSGFSGFSGTTGYVGISGYSGYSGATPESLWRNEDMRMTNMTRVVLRANEVGLNARITSPTTITVDVPIKALPPLEHHIPKTRSLILEEESK